MILGLSGFMTLMDRPLISWFQIWFRWPYCGRCTAEFGCFFNEEEIYKLSSDEKNKNRKQPSHLHYTTVVEVVETLLALFTSAPSAAIYRHTLFIKKTFF